MTTRSPVSLIFLSMAFLVACGDKPDPTMTLSGHSMGTTFSVIIVDPAPELSLDTLRSQIQRRLDQIEMLASTYRDSSEISKFNLSVSTDWIAVPDELCAMVSAAAKIGRETGGAFDITVGPLVDLWGFGPGPMRNEPPLDRDIETARGYVGYSKLGIDCKLGALRKPVAAMTINLSGWAKGYAVDQLAELLESAGLSNFLVEVGGEIKVRGHNAENRRFAIAIESPSRNTKDDLAIIHVSDSGLATSGGYRNFFEFEGNAYSHTIDPRTGRPVQHKLSAVTVVHTSTAYADAVATALLVLGPEEGMALANKFGIAAYFAIATDEGLEYRSSDAFGPATAGSEPHHPVIGLDTHSYDLPHGQ